MISLTQDGTSGQVRVVASRVIAVERNPGSSTLVRLDTGANIRVAESMDEVLALLPELKVYIYASGERVAVNLRYAAGISESGEAGVVVLALGPACDEHLPTTVDDLLRDIGQVI